MATASRRGAVFIWRDGRPAALGRFGVAILARVAVQDAGEACRGRGEERCELVRRGVRAFAVVAAIAHEVEGVGRDVVRIPEVRGPTMLGERGDLDRRELRGEIAA